MSGVSGNDIKHAGWWGVGVTYNEGRLCPVTPGGGLFLDPFASTFNLFRKGGLSCCICRK